MDVPGGLIRRPRVKLYDPTFWPARSFVYAEDVLSGEGLTVFLGGPASASFGGRGDMEWVVLRNAPKEKAYKILPLLAHPAAGTDPDEHAIDYAIWATRSGEFPKHRPPWVVRQVLGESWLSRQSSGLDDIANGLVTTDDSDVLVRAVKHADRGHGLIVRLAADGPSGRVVHLMCGNRAVKKAYLCDARERNLEELPVGEEGVAVPVRMAIVTVRLLT